MPCSLAMTLFSPQETQINILTVNLLFSTIVFAIAAKLYLLPMLPRLEPRSVVIPILLLHALRHLGLMFLAPGAVLPGLPEQFAKPAAFGDLLAAILALVALAAVVPRSSLARPLVGLFNIVGTIDLISAISLATIRSGAVHGARLLDTGVLGASTAGDSLCDLCSSR